ncbi:uncharacterized protein LOC124357644, partial [Homalodisca vitripennis]|uniref:uncharacterized protein LOC124357644 n=1 Tax=Homalodisca vitripennis TaxID=197043 RepID=UPI001EE9DD2C
LVRPREDGCAARVAASRTPGASRSHCEERRTQSVHVWDPKDGELCLARTKSGETLMEVRSDSDVQIVRAGYRGERLIEPSSSWFPPKFPSG